MTVEELIQKLQECPPDYVVVNVHEEEFFEVEIDKNEQIVVITD